MQDISEKIIKEIEEKKIKPTPRVFFRLIDYFFWSIFGICVLVGVFAGLTLLLLLIDNDWDVYAPLGYNFLTYIVISLPYFWGAVFGAFLIISYFAYRATKNGYRTSATLVFMTLFFGALIIGALFFAAGYNPGVHEYMMRFPAYDKMVFSREDVWCCGERGLIGGTITDVPDQFDFMLKDFSGKVWLVKVKTARILPGVIIKVDKRVGIIGNKENENEFNAIEVRPWGDLRFHY